MDRNRPISIMDDSPKNEPRDSWSRLRETVAKDKKTSVTTGVIVSQIFWGMLAIICLAIGIGGGYYLVKTYDVRGMLENVGFMSGTAPATADKGKADIQTAKKTRNGTRAVNERDAFEPPPSPYNVEIVDNKAREDDFVAVAKDSDGRVFRAKPAQLPAVIIPHALPTSTPHFGVAKPALPSPAVKALSLDQYRNLSGSVTLQANIGNDGAMKEYSVLAGPKELVDPAVAVAREQRFDPPRKNYAARWTTITVNFKK